MAVSLFSSHVSLAVLSPCQSRCSLAMSVYLFSSHVSLSVLYPCQSFCSLAMSTSLVYMSVYVWFHLLYKDNPHLHQTPLRRYSRYPGHKERKSTQCEVKNVTVTCEVCHCDL